MTGTPPAGGGEEQGFEWGVPRGRTVVGTTCRGQRVPPVSCTAAISSPVRVFSKHRLRHVQKEIHSSPPGEGGSR